MNRILLTLAISTTTGIVFAQNVGISEAAPGSKLDVVQTENTGNSLELSHNIAANGSSGLWLKNNGAGMGLNVNNNVATNASRGIQVTHAGLGDGIGVFLNNAGNANPSAYLQTAGTGDGITNWALGTGMGIYNDVAASYGLFNVLRSNTIGTINLHSFAGGTGEYIDLDIYDGTGVVVYGVDNAVTPTNGGDVFAFDARLRTATPTGGGLVYGGVMYGEQSGSGHGILVNHSGAAGRNAEFNLQNTANTDPVMFLSHQGHGSAVQAQNQSNVITGTMTVGDFAYTGTDIADHIGVSGFSAPAVGWGIGVEGTGNWYGLFSFGNSGATGAKTFLIDHPHDPANKMLRHFSVESNEVLNMYRGMVSLDANGQAVVELPEYFEDINTNFSYQLTSVGSPEQPYVLTEIQGNSFEVAGAPGAKVSWVVYADRNDAYMQQNPQLATDVVDKVGSRQGKYLQPELYGQPASSGMNYSDNHINATQTERSGGAPISTQKAQEIRLKATSAQPQEVVTEEEVD